MINKFKFEVYYHLVISDFEYLYWLLLSKLSLLQEEENKEGSEEENEDPDTMESDPEAMESDADF